MQMRTPSPAFLLLIFWFATGHCVGGEALPLFGELPDPGKNWRLREQGKCGDSSFQWHWVILTNSETGDVLSYASHRFEPGERRELIYLSDTAHEIFPAGYPAWGSGSKPNVIGTYSIRYRVTKLDWIDSARKRNLSQKALEYSFVQEEERGTNRMAHGYALVFADVAVYIQHTSTKPITWEYALDKAISLLASRSREKTAANHERPTTPKLTR